MNRMTRKYTFDKDSEDNNKLDLSKLTDEQIVKGINDGSIHMQQTTYTYDCFGNQKEIGDSAGNTVKCSYDDNGVLRKVEHADGTITCYDVDAEGQVIKQTDIDGGIGDDGSTHDTTVTYEYDANGNIIKYTDALGYTTEKKYDYMGNVVEEKSPAGNVTKYEYLPNGKLSKTNYPDGSTSLNTYNYRWYVAQTKLYGGKQGDKDYKEYAINYEYDSFGNVITKWIDKEVQYHYTYDSYGHLRSETDPNGNKTSYEYDENNLLVKEINALGEVTEYEYDAEDRLLRTIVKGKPSKDKTEKDYLITSYVYDSLGRIIQTIRPDGNKESTKYNIYGDVLETTDYAGNVLQKNEYDKYGRIKKSTDVLGLETSYHYEKNGALGSTVQTADKSKPDTDRTYSFKYLDNGSQKEVIDPIDGKSSCKYDADGNITSVKDPMGGVTKYKYDSMGRQISETNAIDIESTTAYDNIGNVAVTKNGRKQITKYQYDDRGRMVQFVDKAGMVYYTYDANGNATEIKEETDEGVRTLKRTYDALNRVTSATDYNGRTVKYGYDEFGNVIALTYPGGEIVRYDYDKLGNVTDVFYGSNKSPEVSYQYDINQRLIKIQNANGTVEEREYDKAGNVTSIICTDKDGKEILNLQYEYDKFGDITKRKSSQKETGGDNVETITMTYDKANQLKTYNDIDIEYDADGNMTYGPLKGEMVEFEYDARNRLVKAGNISYEYDALNNRIAQIDEETGIRTDYVLNTESTYVNVLEKYISDGEEESESDITRYIYAYGLVEQISKEENYFYHFDNIGSTRVLTNGNSEVVGNYQYDTYGESLKGDTSKTEYLYNGQYGVTTDENGLYYMRARYYNVDIKRFINQDTLHGSIQNSQSLNRYSYVQGNPVKLNDPFGLCPNTNKGLGDKIKDWIKDKFNSAVSYIEKKVPPSARIYVRAAATVISIQAEITYRAANFVYTEVKEHGHQILDIAGYIPVVAPFADAANSALYAAEGNYVEAALYGASSAAGFLSMGAGSIATKSARLGAAALKAAKVLDKGVNVVNTLRPAFAPGLDIVKDISSGKRVSNQHLSALSKAICGIGINKLCSKGLNATSSKISGGFGVVDSGGGGNASGVIKGGKNTGNPVIDNMQNRVPNNEITPPNNRGNAPLSNKDGKPIEIHHSDQEPLGPFKEMHPSDHRYGANYKNNHPNYNSKSKIDRTQFRKWKQEYWENEWDNGRWNN